MPLCFVLTEGRGCRPECTYFSHCSYAAGDVCRAVVTAAAWTSVFPQRYRTPATIESSRAAVSSLFYQALQQVWIVHGQVSRTAARSSPQGLRTRSEQSEAVDAACGGNTTTGNALWCVRIVASGTDRHVGTGWGSGFQARWATISAHKHSHADVLCLVRGCMGFVLALLASFAVLPVSLHLSLEHSHAAVASHDLRVLGATVAKACWPGRVVSVSLCCVLSPRCCAPCCLDHCNIAAASHA